LKHDMHTGDLLLWKEKYNLLKWIYRKLICSKGDHTSLIIRLQQYDDAQRRYTIEANRKQGTALNLLSRRLDGFVGEVWLYKLKSDWTPDERKEIGKVILGEIGKPYDCEAMMKTWAINILRRIFKNIKLKWKVDARELFCSEYCYLAYKTVRGEEGLKKLHGNGEDLLTFEGPPHPKDLIKLKIFQKPPICLYSSTSK